MTFEKEFPSLKEKRWGIYEGYDSTWMTCETDNLFAPDFGKEDIYYKEEDIKKYCLDKQKVREVIDKIIEYDMCAVDSVREGCVMSFKEELKKELKL